MPNDLISDLEMEGIRVDVLTLFVDVGVIDRPDPDALGDFDPDDASITEPEHIEIYDGPMSIYPISARRDTVDIQGQGLIYVRQYRVTLPYDAPQVQIGDRVTMTTSRDPQLEGRPMEVRDVFVSTNVGYRRLTVHDTKE